MVGSLTSRATSHYLSRHYVNLSFTFCQYDELTLKNLCMSTLQMLIQAIGCSDPSNTKKNGHSSQRSTLVDMQGITFCQK